MPKVITKSSTVKCAHQGTITFTASQQKLKVDGQAVLVTTDVVTGTVSNCQTVPSSPPAPLQVKCTKVLSLSVGAAAKLTVGGTPVLLETAAGLTNGVTPVPSNFWSVQSAGQTKFDAI